MIIENIKNLTSFWKTGVKPSEGLSEGAGYKAASVQNSGWPNKIWQEYPFDHNNVNHLIGAMKKSTIPLTMPVWQSVNPDEEILLDNDNIHLKFKQVGMSLPLTEKFELKNELEVTRVNDESKAAIWSEIYPLAFNYEFPKHVLVNTLENIEYYLFTHEEKPVGTGILFARDGIAGIHGIGVPPYARQRGFAAEITKFLVNKSIEDGNNVAVLQASVMGYSIYKKLGFREDFRISNYVLK